MKIAIVGTRNLTSYSRFLGRLMHNCPQITEATEIVSGGAKGTDTLAERYAFNNKLPIKIFLPDYSRYGKAAPLMRNTEIVDYADQVVAFVDPTSRGTWDSINKAREAHKPLTIISLNDEEEVLESWVREGLCEPGYEFGKERARIRGDVEGRVPSPNYRLTLWKSGEWPQEGGYFHYKEDALTIKDYLERLLSGKDISIKLDELPEKDYEFKKNKGQTDLRPE